VSGSSAPVTEVKDYGEGKSGIASRWITELEIAGKETATWEDQAAAIERRYRDERKYSSGGARTADSYKFNVLWSNVQTLMPAIYARPPKPVVGRRFRDRDPVGRAASQIIERGLDYTIDCEGLHHTIKLCVLDFLLSGRGTVWLRYEPSFKESAREDGVQIEQDPEQKDELAYEEAECDYVHWTDFQCSPSRVWEEVRWVSRRVYMTRDAMRKKFKHLSEAVIQDIPLDWKPKNQVDSDISVEHQAFQRATVWEIWDKEERKVVFIAPAYTQAPLDIVDDPLRLEGFFPCPRPLLSTTTNGTIVPVPDYVEYQDQADQLDELTGRIAMVTKAIKVAGFYPAEEKDVARLLSENVENALLPVHNWAAFIDKGGLEKLVALMPVERLATVLRDLTEIRAVVKNDLYEITGISDIIRGSTKASETATAQEIKGRYASMRLSDRQQEVARFVRDVMRMMGEIMCEHFTPQTLLLLSDYHQIGEMPELPEGMQPNDPAFIAKMQEFEVEKKKAEKKIAAAIALLKNEKARGFRIDIEDESTVAQDDMAEKQARVEFLGAVSGFLQQAVPASQAVPEMAPLMGKMLLFGVRAFRAGRDMETSIEDALAEMEKAQKAAADQPKPPSPEEVAAQAEAASAQAKMQAEQQKAEVDIMATQADLEIRKMEMDAKERSEQRAHEFAMADLELKAMQAGTADKKAQAEMRRMDAEGQKTALETEALTREKKSYEAEDAQTQEMADRMDRMEGGLMEVAAGVSQAQEALVQQLKSLSGPKKIIRGPDGRAVGVEPMVMQ